MKLMLVFHWKSSIEPDCKPDYAFKVVEMPCLPPIGTQLWLWRNGDVGYLFDGDQPTVQSIAWDETRSEWLEVHLSEMELGVSIDDGDAMLEEAGWTISDYPAD